ncbi:DMT family transporter [Streptomyces hilarionis]|uniref:DMT family transporter n=1 Tax=Streptomyces hilarionis TaxID=2839954 RepID=UPI00211A5A96|nr:DMT family transporter [Streptomyces hilarionis]MCQ9135745.1 DMT family transporter [Streptomyces hilarionis]
MSALAFSVVLSLVSAVAYAGGAIMQEQVAVSSPEEEYAPLRRPVWWAAVALNGLGGLLHVVALAYGPLSLVQPLGALTIVFALPMAALFVGRRAGATAWRGAIMATVGLAGLLSLVGASDAQSLSTAQRVAVAVVTAGAVVTLMIAGRAAHRHPAVRSMLLATASGIAFGMSSVFTKTVAVDWTDGVSAADLPSLAVIGVLATAGILLSQAAYRGAGLAAPLATLTVVNPVVAAAVGITMFGETFRYGATGTVLALGCGVVAAGGLILLTTERLQTSPPQSEQTQAVQTRTVLADPAPASEAVAATSGTPVAATVDETDPSANASAVPPPRPGPRLRLPEQSAAAASALDGALLNGVFPRPEAPGTDAPGVGAPGTDDERRQEARADDILSGDVLPDGGVLHAALLDGVLLGGRGLGDIRLDDVRPDGAGLDRVRLGEPPAQGGDTRPTPVPASAPAGAAGDPVEQEPSAPDVPASFYTPLYGGLFVPMPVVDRHRERVKS